MNSLSSLYAVLFHTAHAFAVIFQKHWQRFCVGLLHEKMNHETSRKQASIKATNNHIAK